MEVRSAASGATLALLDAAEVEGKSAREVKNALAGQLGVTRFRQKLLSDDGRLIKDAEVFSGTAKIQLVKLDFCPPDEEGHRKMFNASASGDVTALGELLESPRNPDVTDHDGWTSLHYAALNGCVGPTRLLLEAGAEKDAVSDRGETPLHLAAPW